MKSLIESWHSQSISQRRIVRLKEALLELIPKNASVLDVGCGNGLLTKLLAEERTDVRMEGIDIKKREKMYYPIKLVTGDRLPCEDHSYDVVMFVDVLHHTTITEQMLREAVRVSRRNIIIKDHLLCGWLSGPTLRLMDDIGNRNEGIAMPYNYWAKDQWSQAFQDLGLHVDQWKTRLALYPEPLNWMFERNMHFIAKLSK